MQLAKIERATKTEDFGNDENSESGLGLGEGATGGLGVPQLPTNPR